MKSSTLFKAFKLAERRKAVALAFRRKRTGVSVDKDAEALRWQRANRQAAKLSDALDERLENE